MKRSNEVASAAALVSLAWISPLSAAEISQAQYNQPITDVRATEAYGNYFVEDGAQVSSPRRVWKDQSIKLGRVDVHAGLGVSSVFDDRILINGVQRQKDLVWTFSPNLTFGLGDYRGNGNAVTLDYRPDYFLYTDKDQFNGLDHTARLAGRYSFSKLSIGLAQGYQDTVGNLVEVANRVRTKSYQTFLGLNYDWTEKTSFTLNGRQNITDYKGFNEIKDWLSEFYGNWRATEKLKLSLGGAYGVRDVVPGPNEDYEQALVRASYFATEKLTVDANLGAEFHQYQGGEDEGPFLVFGLGTTWQPREGWIVSIEGHRRQQPSVGNGGLNILLTGVSGLVQKRIFERYSLNLAGSFDRADYGSRQVGVSTSRSDDYWSVSPSLDCAFTERWRLSLFYLYRENISSGGGGATFCNNQFGLRTHYEF